MRSLCTALTFAVLAIAGTSAPHSNHLLRRLVGASTEHAQHLGWSFVGIDQSVRNRGVEVEAVAIPQGNEFPIVFELDRAGLDEEECFTLVGEGLFARHPAGDGNQEGIHGAIHRAVGQRFIDRFVFRRLIALDDLPCISANDDKFRTFVQTGDQIRNGDLEGTRDFSQGRKRRGDPEILYFGKPTARETGPDGYLFDGQALVETTQFDPLSKFHQVHKSRLRIRIESELSWSGSGHRRMNGAIRALKRQATATTTNTSLVWSLTSIIQPINGSPNPAKR